MKCMVCGLLLIWLHGSLSVSAQVSLSVDGRVRPYPTIHAAVEAAREVSSKRSRTILLGNGPHYLSRPLLLDHRDNGLVIEAQENAQPVVLGGFRLKNWRQASPRIWAAANVPVGSRFRMLLVNGTMAPRSRYPAKGTLRHLNTWSVPWMSTSGGGWKTKPSRDQLTTLNYNPKDISEQVDLRSSELTIIHKWDESLVTVKTHDRERAILHFHSPAGHPPGAFDVHEYYLTNVAEGMTEPGQWYLDHTRNQLAYLPRRQDRFAAIHVVAPTMNHIVHVRGTAYSPVKKIRIRGVRFSVADSPAIPAGFGAHKLGGAIELAYTEDCVLDGITVSHVAGHGIRDKFSKNLTIEHCHIHHCGAGGIKFTKGSKTIRNNLVEKIGLTASGAIGIWGSGDQSVIDHNTVRDVPYSGIMMNGSSHTISNNLVQRAMRVLEDGGGIYITFCNKVTIAGNVVSEFDDKDASAYYLEHFRFNLT